MNIEAVINDNGLTMVNFNDFLIHVIDEVGFEEGRFELSFCSDALMKKLHQKYLNKNTSTDVLTFNLSGSEVPFADIYICVDEAKKNSVQYKSSLEDEIKLLIVHAILHLKGFEDYTNKDRKIMFLEQDRILEKIKSKK